MFECVQTETTLDCFLTLSDTFGHFPLEFGRIFAPFFLKKHKKRMLKIFKIKNKAIWERLPLHRHLRATHSSDRRAWISHSIEWFPRYALVASVRPPFRSRICHRRAHAEWICKRHHFYRLILMQKRISFIHMFGIELIPIKFLLFECQMSEMNFILGGFSGYSVGKVKWALKKPPSLLNHIKKNVI